jgi:hypothetical protein
MEKRVRILLFIVAALVVVAALLFPLRVEKQTTYVAPDGTRVGTIRAETFRPWWFPKKALVGEAPLSEADAGTRSQLLEQARRTGNTKALAALGAGGTASSSGNASNESTGSTGGQTSGSTSSETTASTPPGGGSSTGSGATIESRIPAKITGYKLESEQRAILSWYGMFKPDSGTDGNIVFASVTIEQIGADRAKATIDEFVKRFGSAVKSVRVEGLQAYEAAIGDEDVTLVFADDDFLYTVRLNVKQSAASYLDEAVTIAEEALI